MIFIFYSYKVDTEKCFHFSIKFVEQIYPIEFPTLTFQDVYDHVAPDLLTPRIAPIKHITVPLHM